MSSVERVPNPPPRAVHEQQAFGVERTKVLFERIPAGTGERDHFADGDAAVVLGLFQDAGG